MEFSGISIEKIDRENITLIYLPDVGVTYNNLPAVYSENKIPDAPLKKQ